jgi:hypothetical protein
MATKTAHSGEEEDRVRTYFAPATVEITVVGRSRASRKGIRVHRIRAIDDREVRHHEGLR